MAKVQPLYGVRKYDWTFRLTALITAVGDWAIQLGEEGTKRTSMSLHRRGWRFTLTSRVWGRLKHHDCCIILHSAKTSAIISVRDNKLTDCSNIKTEEKWTDHKSLYKLLERRVYATFTPDQASEIMSRGDDLYNILTRDY